MIRIWDIESVKPIKTIDASPADAWTVSFSPDGKKLVFSSNRNNGGTRDTNLFIADWKD
jgi:WD40 repeat protein